MEKIRKATNPHYKKINGVNQVIIVLNPYDEWSSNLKTEKLENIYPVWCHSQNVYFERVSYSKFVNLPHDAIRKWYFEFLVEFHNWK